ncbi:hydrolase 1, exosortase A system-associated [Janthinobacterium fluminis]|uniref:Hydrolase 1, exosortase A system-associated n=1 Tax=Janthinobacterium fluminis TaxID=2987524 RepID=A0ABT5JVV8_9BURK|nr:hydrolase 1, exosortase A system-associated [Janthinobacterium fluminis]MDC8756841.1 hydrolase 1, exosortase A system-associated [Janthinobacterium fluminis]
MPALAGDHDGGAGMIVEQRALRFQCQSCWLFGILSLPERPRPRGVLIVTGGPQYRIGSHRQFTLLARVLAERGIPVLRFDYRGMGDSEGAARNYEDVGADIDSALRQFFAAVPQMRELVLWGLCDGATAAALHACADSRICGLILLNPWVRTTPGLARATLRHYYLARLRDPAFWRKLAGGGLRLAEALRSLLRLAGAARAPDAEPAKSAPQRMFEALSRFKGRVLIILSGDDLTACEFADLQNSSPAWRKISAGPLLRQVHLAQANHTFSRALWRDQVAQLSVDWITSW